MVCVGLSDYPGELNDLSLSAFDAVTMRNLYEKNGHANVVSYVNSEAIKRNVLLAIENIFYKASEEDVIVFFFSGHGKPGCFICYDGILKYDEITSIMGRSKARRKLIFADACFSGKVREETAETDGEIKGDVLFFLSCRSGETSIEMTKGWQNSLFTAHLERGLRGGADANRDRVITAKELYDFVNSGVSMQSKGKQHPVMWGRFSKDMPIMIWERRN